MDGLDGSNIGFRMHSGVLLDLFQSTGVSIHPRRRLPRLACWAGSPACLFARDQISLGWRTRRFPEFGIRAAARVLNSAGDSLKILYGIVRTSVCKSLPGSRDRSCPLDSTPCTGLAVLTGATPVVTGSSEGPISSRFAVEMAMLYSTRIPKVSSDQQVQETSPR
jgi:hypothetical protein